MRLTSPLPTTTKPEASTWVRRQHSTSRGSPAVTGVCPLQATMVPQRKQREDGLNRKIAKLNGSKLKAAERLVRNHFCRGGWAAPPPPTVNEALRISSKAPEASRMSTSTLHVPEETFVAVHDLPLASSVRSGNLIELPFGANQIQREYLARAQVVFAVAFTNAPTAGLAGLTAMPVQSG